MDHTGGIRIMVTPSPMGLLEGMSHFCEITMRLMIGLSSTRPETRSFEV